MKLILFALIVLFIVYEVSYPHFNEKRYYKEINHYISSTAVVKNIIYSSSQSIVIWIDEADEAYNHGGELIWYPTFEIKGESVAYALENGIEQKLQIGDEIIFTSAPEIFYNGHALPIVHLEVNGEVLLPFEEGYENLMDLYLFG